MRIVPVVAFAAGAVLVTVARPAIAQNTPSDLRDLVGMRGSSGETQMEARGYEFIRTETGQDRKWTYWWNARRGQCVSVTTYDGRYNAIVTTLPADCGRSGGDVAGNRPIAGGGETINLICFGTGRKPGYSARSGYQWDFKEHRYRPKIVTESVQKEFDSSVMIQIEGDRGRIRPNKKMIPPIHSGDTDGWWNLQDLQVSRRQISAGYNFNGANKPRMTIDRRSGRIAIKGLSSFTGTCDTIDENHRRF